jgi:hypothetical protein
MQSRLLALIALCGLVVGMWSCSSMPSSNSLASADHEYRPKYLPAADVIQTGAKSGQVGHDTYVCGDVGCRTAVRAD